MDDPKTISLLKTSLASKKYLAEMETRLERRMSELIKSIYIVGVIQFIAIVGSVLAIVNFMLK